ncbi:MAG: phosphate ABC transporter substrate-binding protein [Mycoplasmatales bacterium]
MKRIYKVLSSLLLAIILTGCAAKDSKSTVISIGGSTSVQQFAEEHLIPQANADLGMEATYQATGSADGVVKATEGTYNIGMSSRDLKPAEAKKVESQTLAYDGIAVIVNEQNPVKNLTSEQLQAIYKGEITNWNQVGGEDREISVVSREDGSGTRTAFEELAEIEDGVDADVIQSGNGDVGTTVKMNPSAIGYISFQNLSNDLTTVAIDGVAALPKNVLNKTYKLARPFVMVWNKEEQSENSQKYIEWIIKNSSEIAPEAGLIPVD